MAKKRDIVVLDKGFTRNQSRTSPEITTAKAKMTATELKAFYQISTLIQMNDDDFSEYEINVSDFMRELNLNETNREQVVKLCKNLLRQVFEIEQENGDYVGYTIFSRLHYKHKTQKINVKFNDEMKPYLLQLKRYTKINQIGYIKQFDSKYAIRIYVLLKDYRLLSYRDIEIEALAKMLDLPSSYKTFTYISDKVLTPAVTEINAKSDLEIYSIEPIEKLGKKIIKIRVNFGNKADKQASDILKHIEQIYKKAKQDPSVFYGYYYAISEKPQSSKELFKITRIEADARPYFTVYSGTQTLFAILGKKEFAKRLFDGIYRALAFTAEQEKKQQLDLSQWQTHKDKVAQMKGILASWGSKA